MKLKEALERLNVSVSLWSSIYSYKKILITQTPKVLVNFSLLTE